MENSYIIKSDWFRS